MILHRMIVGDLHRLGHHAVLPLLRVHLRRDQQMPVGHLLARFAPLDAQQIERIEGGVVNRRQGTSTRCLPAPRILAVLLALVVRQHGEQEERRLARGQHDAIILEVVPLSSGRCDKLHFPWIRYLDHFSAI